MNIAIYYANFNPITINDVSIINSIFNDLDIDKVWVIINSKKGFLSINQRIKICKNELSNKNIYIDQSYGFDLYEYVDYYKKTFINDNFYIVTNPHDFNNFNKKILSENKFIISNGFLYDNKREEAKSISMIYNHNILINENDIINYIKLEKNPEPFISHKSHILLKNIINEDKKKKQKN